MSQDRAELCQNSIASNIEQRRSVTGQLEIGNVRCPAEMLQCSTRTVQRKLKDIESLWVELS